MLELLLERCRVDLTQRLAQGLVAAALLLAIAAALIAALLLAAIMLLHPYQAIVPTAALGIYALFGDESRAARLGWLRR